MKACCESFKSRLAFACRHDAFFYFHNINAFEAGDDLCIDLAAYKDNQIIAHLHRANLLFNLQAHEPAIPRRSDSAVFCGLAHWLVLTCLCCLPTGNLPVHIGNPPLPLADLSLRTVVSLWLLVISLCLFAVHHWPRPSAHCLCLFAF